MASALPEALKSVAAIKIAENKKQRATSEGEKSHARNTKLLQQSNNIDQAVALLKESALLNGQPLANDDDDND